MIQTHNTVSEVLVIAKQLYAKESLSDEELFHFVNEVYIATVDKYINRFQESKNNSTTLQQCEDAADFIIDFSCTLISASICSYAKDRACNLYELSLNESRKLKDKLSKIISQDANPISNELFSQIFSASFIGAIRNAQEHKNLIKQNKQNIEN